MCQGKVVQVKPSILIRYIFIGLVAWSYLNNFLDVMTSYFGYKFHKMEDTSRHDHKC